MKTTIELPDELFRRLKEQARREGRPMRELVIDGLRRELEERAHPRSRVDFTFPTSSAEGWLAAGITLNDAIEASYPVSS
ncbi:MAG TPA: hypothetical protein VFQ01_00665 [Nocardioides sp.]|jgi:predicted transcriptional regulator|nr:hypothetical protein [Nocardioides sp.]